MRLKTVWIWSRIVFVFLIVVVGLVPLMAACHALEVPGEWRTVIGGAWGYFVPTAYMTKWDLWRFQVIVK